MTITYPAEQVGTIASSEARQILTERGLPEPDVMGFYPVRELRPLEQDPAYTLIGMWGSPGAPIAVNRADGSVVCFSRWSTKSGLVNTSLKAFVDSLDAIESAAPLSADDPEYAVEASERVRDILERIDPIAMTDLDGFWEAIVDDIANGLY